MKIVDLTGVEPKREPVAALLDAGSWSGPRLLLKSTRGNGYMIWADNSTGAVDWDDEVNHNAVLKFYYPGDRITIEL